MRPSVDHSTTLSILKMASSVSAACTHLLVWCGAAVAATADGTAAANRLVTIASEAASARLPLARVRSFVEGGAGEPLLVRRLAPSRRDPPSLHQATLEQLGALSLGGAPQRPPQQALLERLGLSDDVPSFREWCTSLGIAHDATSQPPPSAGAARPENGGPRPAAGPVPATPTRAQEAELSEV